MKNTETIIKVILAILFIGCLFDWQYSYFQLVRFLGMIGFAILAYNQYKKNDFFFVTWLASAILINPFFKIALGRTVWNIVDVIWAVLLIVSIFYPAKETIDNKSENWFTHKIN
jgi:hypothetical protein